MQREELEEIWEQTKQKVEGMMFGTKASEYTRTSILENFEAGSNIDNTTPMQTWWGYTKKHVVSLITFLNDERLGRDIASEEKWYEKIDDLIIYLILLKAILEKHYFDKPLMCMFNFRNILGKIIRSFNKPKGGITNV